MKIHIGVHFFGAGNLGDDLMLDGFLKALGDDAQALTFSCCTPFDRQILAGRFPGIEWLPYDDASRRSAIQRADRWLALGSTPFQLASGPWMAEHLEQELAYCKAFGCPAQFLAAGVGDTEALGDRRMLEMLAYAETIWTRDERSAAALRATRLCQDIRVAADLAHVSLSQHAWPAVAAYARAFCIAFENTETASQATRLVAMHEGERMAWLVQETRRLPGCELALLSTFDEERRSHLDAFTPDYSARSVDALLHTWPRFALLVSSRYHASLIGAWSGAKIIPLARGTKLAGAADDLGIPLLDPLDAHAVRFAMDHALPVERSRLVQLAGRATEGVHEWLASLKPETPSKMPGTLQSQRLSPVARAHAPGHTAPTTSDMQQPIKIERLDRNGLHPSAANEVVPGMLRGEIFVLRRALQALEIDAEIHARMAPVLADVLPPPTVAQLQSEGYAGIHNHLDGAQLEEVTRRLLAPMGQLGMHMVKRVAHELLGVTETLFIQERADFRCFVPQDTWLRHRQGFMEFEREFARGKLTLHGPHQDCWFYHPTNAVNFWSAISPVVPGNGMSFFPEFFGTHFAKGTNGEIATGQYYGQAMNLQMDCGDILAFHSNHLHGSELNQTNATRVALSGRFTVGAPHIHDRPWYNYLPDGEVPDQVGTRPAPFTSGEAPPSTPPVDIDTAGSFPTLLKPRLSWRGWRVALTDFGPQGVRPLSSTECLVRTEAGLFRTPRKCPHAGEDLAGGYVRDGKLVCPRHNLALDPASGESACNSLKLGLGTRCATDGTDVYLGWSRP